MAMGWRNVVLQVGEPIKDVAGYLESVTESARKKSPPILPPLFSISELSILLRYMSQIYRDPLTGVLIRRAILKILEREITRANSGGGSLAVAIFDVDFFKRFNDSHGHLVGDAVLRHVARRMEEALGEGALLGRWGGEEFMVVCPGLKAAGALSHFDRIREFVSTPLRLDSGEEVSVTVSGGWAFFAPGMSEDEIFKLADKALYRAKESGRNRVFQADPAIDGTTSLREES
jgi:diguanylate cyclase